MTMLEFIGCGLIAFGPALSMFILTIAKDPLRIIVCVASAFFWLLSLLISAAWWRAVVPLQEKLAFGLVFSVIFQEFFRLGFYLILRKAEEGLHKVWQMEAGDCGMSLVANKSLLAYVSGFGFGLISGVFSLVNVLAAMTGPGTVGLYGESTNFFITSALLTLVFILLHTFWNIVFFDGCRRKRYIQPIIVILSHAAISSLTLLNQSKNPPYAASLVPAYLCLLIFVIWSFIISGGSINRMKACFTRTPARNL